jgi:hypothetical protein
LRSIWLQARLHTAPQFCGLEIVNGPLTVGIVAFEKAGAHRVTLRADPARAPHADWRLRLALQAVENSVRLFEPLRLTER